MRELFKYCLVGAINTVIGLGLIIFLTFLGLLPEWANFLSYCVGIICSYFLNKIFTFKSKNLSKKEGIKFILMMILAYCMNFIVLLLTYRVLNFNVYFSQILAAITYTISGFLLSKFFVFKK